MKTFDFEIWAGVDGKRERQYRAAIDAPDADWLRDQWPLLMAPGLTLPVLVIAREAKPAGGEQLEVKFH